MIDIMLAETIASRIYLIRCIKVMFDRDLAELYEVETAQLKRAVRQNSDRFPDDFMFELIREVPSIEKEITKGLKKLLQEIEE